MEDSPIYFFYFFRMWFSNKSHSAYRYIKIKWLKKEEPQHYWEVDNEKVEDSTFEGRLVKVSPDEYEYEGAMRQTVKFLFVDATAEYYQLDTSYNSLSRSLINTLLGYIDTLKEQWHNNGKLDLELSLYINKENYKQMWIKINWERGKWRYDIEAQRKMIETITKKNGTKENDYFEYDEKLKSCLSEIQNFIEVTDFIEEKKESLKDTLAAREEIAIEDIPF